MRKDKEFISILSFVAVFVAGLTMIWSIFTVKSDLQVTTFIVGILGSVFGVVLSIVFRRLSTKKYRDKIFISRSSKDKEFADFLRNKLKKESFILNIDESNILVGENVLDVINKELEDSSIVIVILSKNSINSKFVNCEIETALDKGKILLPVIIDEDIEIPDSIKWKKYADFSTDKREGFYMLKKSLDYYLTNKKTSP